MNRNIYLFIVFNLFYFKIFYLMFFFYFHIYLHLFFYLFSRCCFIYFNSLFCKTFKKVNTTNYGSLTSVQLCTSSFYETIEQQRRCLFSCVAVWYNIITIFNFHISNRKSKMCVFVVWSKIY